MAVVEAHGLVKRFREREVVSGVDLRIEPGRCFGLLGPNGAGKTTTLRLLLGQLVMDAGSLTVLGLPVPEAARAVRARTGVVPQLDNLDPDFTVGENLRVYGRYFGISRSLLDERIGRLLSFVELSDRADARIETLSGGMKRRLTIARALVNEPDLLILDEPTTGLDPQARHMIWGRLRALRERGTTLLLTTHFMEEAERLCDRLMVLDHGRVLDEDSPTALIRRHVEAEVLEIRGSDRLVQAAVEGLGDCRVEALGDTYFCYTRDARALVSRLEQRPELTFLHRPANLEDVFLKLTGRELRD